MAPDEQDPESRMRENRPSGLMRGGARRSLALCLSIRQLRLLYTCPGIDAAFSLKDLANRNERPTRRATGW